MNILFVYTPSSHPWVATPPSSPHPCHPALPYRHCRTTIAVPPLPYRLCRPAFVTPPLSPRLCRPFFVAPIFHRSFATSPPFLLPTPPCARLVSVPTMRPPRIRLQDALAPAPSPSYSRPTSIPRRNLSLLCPQAFPSLPPSPNRICLTSVRRPSPTHLHPHAPLGLNLSTLKK